MNNQYAGLNPSNPTYKIVHFADLHLDFEYLEGRKNECQKAICCRKVNGKTSKVGLRSGPLGAYNCDAPMSLIEAMGDYINTIIEPDAIVWTGDSVPHDNYAQSFKDREKILQTLTDYFNQQFSDIKIYTSLKNYS